MVFIKKQKQINSLYSQIFDGVNSIIIINEFGEIKKINSKFQTTTKYSNLIKGDFLLNLKDFSFNQKYISYINIEKKGKTFVGELKFISKTNISVWFSFLIIPINNCKNIEYHIILSDITDIKISHSVLEKSLENLNTINNDKTKFLNIVSHEMRTPLTIIKGYLSLIASKDIGNIDEISLLYVNKTIKQVNEIIYLVNNLLDISKIENGGYKLEKSEFNLNDVILNSVNDIKTIFSEKNINIILEINESENLYLNTDNFLLKQILNNIIGNSFKYSLSCSDIKVKTEVSELNNNIKIHIIDNGVGIENVNRVFDIFYQEKNSNIKEVIKGSGLGLSIVKDFLKYINGSIIVNTQQQIGTTMTIILPIINNK